MILGSPKHHDFFRLVKSGVSRRATRTFMIRFRDLMEEALAHVLKPPTRSLY